MDLRDTRQKPVGRSPPAGWFWSFPSAARRSRYGGPGGCRRAPFFGETLIRYRIRGTPTAPSAAAPHRARPPGVRGRATRPARPADGAGATYPGSLVTVTGKCGQALKGAWWMSWHREATKDVVACDKLREAGKRALIRRCPNEETQPGSHLVTPRRTHRRTGANPGN